MQIFISTDFSKSLENKQLDIYESFIKTIKELRENNKTNIINSESIVELSNSKGPTFYAYHINGTDSFYVLIAFLEKNKLVILDVVNLIDEDNISSFVYSENTNEE